MSSTTPTSKPATNQGEDRPVRFSQVMRPVGLVGLMLLAALLLLVLSFSPIGLKQPGQVSIIANVLLICFTLLPLLICNFVLYMVLMMVIYGVNVLERSGRNGLRSVQQRTDSMAQRASEATQKIGQRSVGLGSRLAYLGTFFDQKSPGTDGDNAPPGTEDANKTPESE